MRYCLGMQTDVTKVFLKRQRDDCRTEAGAGGALGRECTGSPAEGRPASGGAQSPTEDTGLSSRWVCGHSHRCHLSNIVQLNKNSIMKQ